MGLIFSLFFSSINQDVDHKVRESAQTAMAALVGRVGRNLAPYLKTVIAVWILSCNDTYPGVASAARQAFQAAFPEKKQKDVLIFCKQVVVEVRRTKIKLLSLLF